MATIQEVLEAFDILYWGFEITEDNEEDFKYACETMEQFIIKCCCKLPLEWNEIENGNIIFDKKIKEFVKVKDKRIMGGRKYISLEIIKGTMTYEREFEPNRFYRKEVKE